MRTIRNFQVSGKRVLVRCDFNVPLSPEGDILDDFRIQKTLPTINYLLGQKAIIILMSHLDDPEGQVVENLRLKGVQERLNKYLNLEVIKAQDCSGREIEDLTHKMQEGSILLLENLRFHKEEKEGDLAFAKELSKLGDIYINDAFGSCHRPHASIVGVPQYLPSGGGLLLENEIKNLKKLTENPQKPMVAIIAGKKVETKAVLIDRISEISDFVLIGGLIAEEIKSKNIKLKNAGKIIWPVDSLENNLDIGPKTIDLFREKILKAKTIFWNGVLGKIEEDKFSKGTEGVARAISQCQAFSVAGGGETVEFIRKLNLSEKFTHISTGGGAMLAFLSGGELPGIMALGQSK